MGQEVYYAKEDTDCCTRQCCGPARPFDINIVDTQVMGTTTLTSDWRIVTTLTSVVPGPGGDPPDPATTVPAVLLPLLPAGDGGVQPARGGDRQHPAAVERGPPQAAHQERAGRPRAEDRGPLLDLQLRRRRGVQCALRADRRAGGCGVSIRRYREWEVILQVGKISKQWSGFGKEAFTDADNFGINFPLDLDVKVKKSSLIYNINPLTFCR